MRGAIDGAHPAAAQSFVEPILPIEHATQQGIERNVRVSGISLQRRVIERTEMHIVGILLTTSRALKHKLSD